ncbi:serine hydrolase domain-containing protein [Streptomyces sp. NPDC005576]|uniref:serine hydrolase domain-containing protein n=1 Tax=unclassified Streptomyces TaxID=2593676 RepID=UPI0033CEEB50
MTHGITVHGTVAPGFEGVRDTFGEVLAEDTTEPGSQLSVRLRGRTVVDLWAGEGIGATSLLPVFSSTKGAAHLVVALLVQDGTLDLDRTVASYWPGFAANGTDTLTLRELLAHRSGLVGARPRFTDEELADDRLVAERLVRQEPFWKPGTAYGYHAVVIGALTGEVVRRATGRPIQELYEERVRAPYGVELYLGLPEALEPRFVPILPMAPTPEQAATLTAFPPDPEGVFAAAFNLPTDLAGWGNLPVVRALGSASAGGVGSARGLARMYAAAVSGVDGAAPLLTPGTAAEFARLSWPGTDLVTGAQDAFGLGFRRTSGQHPALSDSAFGHSGAAGSQAFADPEQGIAYGYTRRRYAYPGGEAPENARLVDAVVRASRGA